MFLTTRQWQVSQKQAMRPVEMSRRHIHKKKHYTGFECPPCFVDNRLGTSSQGRVFSCVLPGTNIYSGTGIQTVSTEKQETPTAVFETLVWHDPPCPIFSSGNCEDLELCSPLFAISSSDFLSVLQKTSVICLFGYLVSLAYIAV